MGRRCGRRSRGEERWSLGVWSAGRGEERTVEIPRASEKELKWRRGRPYVAMEGKSFVLDKGALAGDDAKALAARAAREALLVERLLGAGHGDGVRDSDQLVARGARLVVLVGEDRCLWLGTLLDHGLDEWDDEGAVATRSRSALYRPKPVSLQRPSNGSLTKKKGGGGGHEPSCGRTFPPPRRACLRRAARCSPSSGSNPGASAPHP